MKTSLTLLLSLLLISFSTIHAQEYYAVHSPDGNSLIATVEISTGVETSSNIATIAGIQVDGCTGMARNPLTGEIFVVAKAGPVFTLGTIDATTGAITPIGVLSEKFSGITFHSNGTLYGITGDGADTSETLYTIDVSNANISMILTPGGFGSDGEALGFNSTNGLLYRFGGGLLFQSIDPVTLEVIELGPLDIEVDNWAHSLVYIPATDNFLFTAATDVYHMSLNGDLTEVSTLIQGSDGYKGMVSTLPSGLEENSVELAFDVFPNPTTDMLVVNLNNTKEHMISIYSIKGELIDQWTVQGEYRVEYVVSTLANGTYSIVLSDGLHEAQRSFVVNK